MIFFSPSKLTAAREAKGWRQADLARAIWGQIRLANGYQAARNRDRISVYERGHSSPNGRNLKRLADALGVAPSDLMDVDVVSPTKSPEFLITRAPGGARVQMDMIMPFSTAAAICDRLDEIARP